MGYFSRMLASVTPLSYPTYDPDDPRVWTTGPVQMSQAGVNVTQDRALSLSSYWACVKVIAEDLSMLPLIMYRRRSDGGKDRAADHPLYDVLHDQSNPWTSSFEFRTYLTACALSWGNGFARIQPGRRGAVDTLIPVHPSKIVPHFDGRELHYEVMRDSGTPETVYQDEMFHLPGLTIPTSEPTSWIFGVSVPRYAREVLGAAIAADSYSQRFWSQDATPGGVLTHPSQLSEEAAQRIGSTWDRDHGSFRGAHKTAVLEEGMKYEAIGMSNEDAQFLQSREFNVIEICRWFRMQPHKIAHLVHATFSNIEHQSIEHVTDTIQPWATRWERAIKRQLIVDKRNYFAEFLFDALMRGDTLSRHRAYTVSTGGPWMVANEARGRENMNPIEGGDELLRPLNTAPAEDRVPAGSLAGDSLYERNGRAEHAEV